MPTYFHMCENTECNHEWEDFYSIAANPPTKCPKCLQETAKRMISGGSGRGIVLLEGDEFVKSVKDGAKALEKQLSKNENAYASVLGEAKYQSIQQRIDRQKRDKY